MKPSFKKLHIVLSRLYNIFIFCCVTNEILFANIRNGFSSLSIFVIISVVIYLYFVFKRIYLGKGGLFSFIITDLCILIAFFILLIIIDLIFVPSWGSLSN
jgi:hypothetical protein